VTGAAGAPRPTISAAVICLDEERNIGACLESLAWCDEIVVVDSGSRDRTVEIARKHATRVLHHEWPGYVAQKNWALEQTTGAWVLCVDADERSTPQLQRAIEAALRHPANESPRTERSEDARFPRSEPPASGEILEAGFEVRRHVFYLGRWIDHGGWYPDWKLRLVRRGRARWGGVDPHDKLIADGPVRRLDADLVHFTYGNFSDHLRTVQRFSAVVSEVQAREGRRFSLLRAILHPPAKFLECWLWKRGFLDGWPGFVIAVTSSFYVFAKYVKLWERTVPRSEPQASGEAHEAAPAQATNPRPPTVPRCEPKASGEDH
jgi:glycosyltransferase involved in cell wall biosynthesis